MKTALLKRKTEMLDTVVRRYNSWVKYRRNMSELAQLSQRDLADLGISRGELKFIARRNAAE